MPPSDAEIRGSVPTRPRRGRGGRWVLFAFGASTLLGACLSSGWEGWQIEQDMAGVTHVYRSGADTFSATYDRATKQATARFQVGFAPGPLLLSGSIRNPITMNVDRAELFLDEEPIALEIPAGTNLIKFDEDGTKGKPAFQVVIDRRVRTVIGTWLLVATSEVEPP